MCLHFLDCIEYLYKYFITYSCKILPAYHDFKRYTVNIFYSKELFVHLFQYIKYITRSMIFSEIFLNI